MTSKDKVDLKIVMLGDSGVGKTCLLVRFLDNAFGDTQATIGASYFKKNITRGDVTYSLGLWDTAGQERYDSLSSFYCRGAGCAIIAFDIKNAESFEHIEKWKAKLESSNPDDDCFVILVASKLDTIEEEEQKVVSKAQGDRLAKELGCIGYVETSSKTGDNVDRVFEIIADNYSKLGTNQPPTSSFSTRNKQSSSYSTVSVSASKSTSKSSKSNGCC